MAPSQVLKDLATLVPEELLTLSGSVFYSGKNAFGGNRPLYILGVNPGGDPVAQCGETVRAHIEKVLKFTPDSWSEYRDESWCGADPGTWRMQPRMLHLLRGLSIDPGETPASNLIFVRSSREASMADPFSDLAERCWSFHRHALDALRCRTILCLGGTAGRWVRSKLDAHAPIDEFLEQNRRGWRSSAHSNGMGLAVVTLTHPSIADWRNPATDPTALVQRVLSR